MRRTGMRGAPRLVRLINLTELAAILEQAPEVERVAVYGCTIQTRIRIYLKDGRILDLNAGHGR